MNYELVDINKEIPEKEGEYFIFFKFEDDSKPRKMLASFYPKGDNRTPMIFPAGLSTGYTLPLKPYAGVEIQWLKELGE